jgi:hypothetical protein
MHETMEVYTTLLTDLKTACEHQVPAAKTLLPSCCLVEDSDAEMCAAK